jgi:pimeloyl-ACP methyl ester carboxylesterase
MAIEKTTIYTVNGHPIHVREENSDKKQIALLIHGWSSSWYALSPLLPLVRDRYRVIAVDLPGYGESPPLPTRATIPVYADLLATLIEELSDKPAVLIGHSMGGMISLTMTLRHPELVERMILVCPTISGRLSVFINLFILPITIVERFPVANSIVSAFERHMLGITDRLMRPASFAARTSITDEDYVQLRADARRPGQGRVRAECFRAMRDNDLRDKLSGIETPTLVLWGMEDNTVPLRDASVVAAEFPDADLRVIPNAGHWPQFETPELTLRYVRGFLGAPIKLLEFLDSD